MARARHQEGSLLITGKGAKAKYRVQYRIDDADGGRTWKKESIGLVSSMSKREAKAKAREIVMAGTGQLPQAPVNNRADTTFQDFYNERFLPLKTAWSEPHRKTFIEITKRYVLPQFGSLQLGKIDKVMVQVHLNNLAKKYSRTTVRHAREKISTILGEAMEQRYLPFNPAHKTDIPREARKASKPILTIEQLSLLISKITDARDKALFLVGTFCAMRTSEIFGLTWDKLVVGEDGTDGVFMVEQVAYEGKLYRDQTKNERSKGEVYIAPNTMKWLLWWKKECPSAAPDALIFTSTNKNGRAKKGTPMWPGAYFSKRIQPIADRLDIAVKINFRLTRRTASSQAQDNKESAATTAAWLRHSVPTNQKHYTEAVPGSVKKAVNDYEGRVFNYKPEKPKLTRVK